MSGFSRSRRTIKDGVTIVDANMIQSVIVDVAGIGDNKVLAYDLATKTLGYVDISGIAGVCSDAQYPNALLLDGTRAMTGNLNMNGKYVYDTNDVLPKTHITYSLGNASKWWKYIRGQFYLCLGNITYATQYGDIIARNNATDHVRIRTESGGTKIVLDAVNGECGIPLAGDIIGLAGKTLDFPLFKVSGVSGVDGSFTTVDGKTVTVSKGLITSIV